ncbi:MAG: hypothetical protein COB35_11235 [Gammaproteobacteria bacterium]|nr:MAG: hypothetical protein COB35_11235 [Gammaproteobacteria bacterium]
MMGREAVISHLMTWLNDGNEADKFYAIRTLSQLQAVESGEKLMFCLTDEDDDVCIEAAIALGELGCEQAVPLLKEAVLHHDLGDVKIAATQALSTIASSKNNQQARALLLDLVLDNNELQGELDGGWNDFWDIQRIAVIAIGEQQISAGVDLLIRLLDSEDDQDIEVEILKSLAQVNEKGINYLLSLIECTNTRTLRRIVNALSFVPSERQAQCLTPLMALLSHQQDEVRLAVCKTLGVFAKAETLTALMPCFVDNNSEVAESAIRAMISIAEKIPNGLANISTHTLLSIAKNAQADASLSLLKIALEMSSYANKMDEDDFKFLARLIRKKQPALLLIANQLLFVENNAEYQPLLIRCFSDQTLAVHIRRSLIHCYGKHINNTEFDITPLLALLHKNSNEKDNDQDNVIRTAVFEVIAQLATRPYNNDAKNIAEQTLFAFVSENPACETEQLAKPFPHNTLNTVNDGQVIPTTFIDDKPSVKNITATSTNEIPKNELSDNHPSTLASIFKSNDEVPAVVVLSANETTVNNLASESVNSTLAALNVFTAPESKQQNKTNLDQDQYLRSLLAEQNDMMTPYSDIVEQHLQNSSQLGLSRKKIAKIKPITNQILASQALAYYPCSKSVNLIIECLRTTNINVARALLTALDRIISQHSKIKGLSNVVGICATLLYGGNNEIQRLAAKILANLKHRQAIPALHDALNNEDQNVRIQTIKALTELISLNAHKISNHQHVVRDESKDEKTIRLISECLNDSEYGVRQAAIGFIQRHKIKKIDQLVSMGCADGGVLANTVGNALKVIDKQQATQVILAQLKQSDSFSQRRDLFQQITCLYGENQTCH